MRYRVISTDSTIRDPSARWARRLAKIVVSNRRNFLLAYGASIVGMSGQVVIPLYERSIVDRTLSSPTSSVAVLVFIVIGLAFLTFGLSFVRRYFGGRLAFDVQHQLKVDLFRHLQRLDFSHHDEMQSGQLMSRANSDVGLVQGFLSFLPMLSGNLVMLIISLAVMFSLSLPLALVELVMVPTVAIAANRLRRPLYGASAKVQQKTGEVSVVVEESITGIRVVKGFGRERDRINTLISGARAIFWSRLGLEKKDATMQSTLNFIVGAVQGGVLLVGADLARTHTITIGTFLVFFAYIVQIASPIRQLGVFISYIQRAGAGASRVFEVLDANPLVADPPNAEAIDGNFDRIVFSNVEFGYDPTDPILKGLNLEIARGEVVAIVGGSGSGKSTLALLLPRFYDPQRGSISLGGQNIRDVAIADLRGRIGVVFEDTFLFSDTVARNISFGRPNATQLEIETAAERAGALDFIKGLPNGFDTMVGENGVMLSGGQIQRISLARALLTDPEILILDDATSAVDVSTEAEINRALVEFSKGRSVLMVAHRKSTLSLATRIVLLDRGVVVADGSYESLVATSELFRRMVSGADESLDLVIDEVIDTDAKADREQLATQPTPALRSSGEVGLQNKGGRSRKSAYSFESPLQEAPYLEESKDGFRFSKFLRPFSARLSIAALLLIVDTLLQLVGPSLVRSGIDKGVIAGSSRAILIVAALYVAINTIDSLVQYSQVVVAVSTSEKILYGLRIKIFSHLMRLGLDYYESELSGRIQTRMTTDLDSMSDLLQDGVTSFIVNLLSFVAVGGLLLISNLKLALAGLWVLIPMTIATLWFARASNRAYTISRERVAQVNANLAEGITGVRVTQAFGMERENSKNFERLSARYRDSRVASQRLVAIYFPLLLLLSEVASASVLYYGTLLIHSHAVTIGVVIAFTLYLDQLFSPVQQLSQTFDSFLQAKVARDRIDDLLNTQTSLSFDDSDDSHRVTDGEVDFDDVTFKYGDKVALHDLSLLIPPGEMVSVVGETGAGKSTLVKLIARFYDPASGVVKVDGVDLRRFTLEGYHSGVGYVPQEAFLFSGTIASNISFSRPDATRDDIVAAAKAVGAYDFIIAMKDGFDCQVSERGRSLSAGQRQLIALARAHLANPKILILDEATANLDLFTEKIVTDAITKVANGVSTIMIAHRLQSATLADRILVVADGMVVEDGTHEDLISRGGKYEKLWRNYESEGATSELL